MYKTVFTDVGMQKLCFEIETETEPTEAELENAVKSNLGVGDVHTGQGRVYLPGKNPGNFLCYGTYATTKQ